MSGQHDVLTELDTLGHPPAWQEEARRSKAQPAWPSCTHPAINQPCPTPHRSKTHPTWPSRDTSSRTRASHWSITAATARLQAASCRAAASASNRS